MMCRRRPFPLRRTKFRGDPLADGGWLRLPPAWRFSPGCCSWSVKSLPRSPRFTRSPFGERRSPVRASEIGRRLAAATAGLAVFAGLLLVVRQKPAPQPTFHQVTFRRTTISCARFGPDGQTVIYEARELPGDRELYLAN